MHTLEALVETGHEIFARAPVTIWAFPHVIASLGRDEQFVAIRAEIVIHKPPHCLLRTAVWRAVVIGKVEMGDAMVESVVRDGSAPLVRVNTTEVMPEAEAHLGKKYATLATTLVKPISVGIAPDVSLIVGFKFHRCLICVVRGGLENGRKLLNIACYAYKTILISAIVALTFRNRQTLIHNILYPNHQTAIHN